MNYNNTISNNIYEILTPLIGKNMAKASIQIQAKKVGKDEESIGKSDLPAISEGIRKSLVVFLGNDGAKKIAVKIERLS